MTSHLLHASLDRPEALDADAWYAISANFERIRIAAAADDRPLVVGAANDLVEATARVVLAARGEPAGDNVEYAKVLGTAHKLIEYQPGPGVTPDAAVRQIATNARKIASCLRELRNDYGTRHGRAVDPQINDELLETCVDAALLWTRWALRRLQFFIIGDVQALVRDLHGSVFRKGTLATRLEAANLPALEPPDQRRLGVAVGRRAATNTFTVWADGVAQCAASQDAVTWPPAYREGVVEGLFLDEFGHFTVDDGADAPRAAAEILVPHPEQARVVNELRARTQFASPSWDLLRQSQKVVAEIERAQELFDDRELRESWLGIAENVKTATHDYTATNE